MENIMAHAKARARFFVLIVTVGALFMLSVPSSSQGPPAPPQVPPPPAGAGPGQGQRGVDFAAQLQRQTDTDKAWRAASAGFMQMEKTSFKSRAGGLEIPAFVFQPLQLRGAKSHPALVWVHPDIRGHLYEYYIPYVKEAVSKGYVVIAPEYRGSVGYGKEFYDAIDYGGAEVDDVLTAVDYLKVNVPQVDPTRIGIIGWSHGGMITLLSITRETTTFKAAVAMVPVTNLFQRLAWAGVERQHQAIDPANRYGGLPFEKHDIYKERSPIYQIDKLQIPLLVHITRNDGDVHIEECLQLVDALRARKPDLSETKVYDNPKGGHLFDRQVDSKTFVPENTREQRDSWNRVWTFLDWNLDPFRDGSAATAK
jgi:dipeptidyl aminopeptidase/acylaminoacyl peptidase